LIAKNGEVKMSVEQSTKILVALALILAATLFVQAFACISKNANTGAGKTEYKVVSLPLGGISDHKIVEQALNETAKEGWKLNEVMYFEMRGTAFPMAIFER